jgi:hypothetical protein
MTGLSMLCAVCSGLTNKDQGRAGLALKKRFHSGQRYRLLAGYHPSLTVASGIELQNAGDDLRQYNAAQPVTLITGRRCLPRSMPAMHRLRVEDL